MHLYGPRLYSVPVWYRNVYSVPVWYRNALVTRESSLGRIITPSSATEALKHQARILPLDKKTGRGGGLQYLFSNYQSAITSQSTVHMQNGNQVLSSDLVPRS